MANNEPQVVPISATILQWQRARLEQYVRDESCVGGISEALRRILAEYFNERDGQARLELIEEVTA